MRAALIAMPLLLALPACHVSKAPKEDEARNGTSISVNAKSDSGEDVKITADGETGKVALNLPGFDANITLPKVVLKDSNFDIDGVKLYPGATVSSVNVKADKSGGGDNARVQIVFSAPAEPKPVRDWFLKAFADKSVKASISGESLVGETRDGTPFTMDFATGKGGSTTGTIVLDDTK